MSQAPGGGLSAVVCREGVVDRCFETTSLSRRNMLESLTSALISSTGQAGSREFCPCTISSGAGRVLLSVSCVKAEDHERQGP